MGGTFKIRAELILAAFARKKNLPKRSGKPFQDALLMEPLGAFGPGEGTIQTNVAATAQVPKVAVAAALDAFFDYGPYGGRNNLASRAGAKMDSGTALYTEKVNYNRRMIEEFIGIDGEKDIVLYGMNTSDLIGKLACMCRYSKDDIILVPTMEHTSNNLPWRNSGATVIRVRQKPDGLIDEADLEGKLSENNGNVRIVAFTAASNINGMRPDVGKLARLVHEYGALAAVDCAQYAPHFPMSKTEWGADFVVFSGHKLGARGGVLAASAEWLKDRLPVIPGGGTIADLHVGRDGGLEPVWAEREAKHQPGTWPTIEIVTLGAVVEKMMERWKEIMAREHELLVYALQRFSEIPGFRPLLRISPKALGEFPTPLVTFNLEGYTASELSARLSENGIQNRGGDKDPICNHEFVRGLEPGGIVRLSFSYHNTMGEIDEIADVLRKMRKERPLSGAGD